MDRNDFVGRWWVYLGRFEAEVRPASEGHVKCDPIGSKDHTVKPTRLGGMVELRPSGRLPGLQLYWWSERAYRLCMAANAWFCEREERKAKTTALPGEESS